MKNAFIFDRNKSEEARNDPLFIDDLKHFAKGLILFQMQSSNIYYMMFIWNLEYQRELYWRWNEKVMSRGIEVSTG